MRAIAVVAYEMEGEPTGVGRYLEELTMALRRTPQAGGWLLRLFFRGDPFEHPLWADPPAGGCRCEPVFDRRPGAHPILWEQFRLPRLLARARPDLVFSPGYSLPRTGSCPAVVAMHDLSFEHLPGDFGFRERWRRRLLARRAARSARRVLTDTRRAAEELQRVYGVAAERIAAIPLGVSPRFARSGVQVGDRLSERPGHGAALAALGVRPPYLLVLGSILRRRRPDLVLRAFGRLLRDPPRPGTSSGAPNLHDLRLVFAGRNGLPRPGDLDRMVAASGAAERVVRLGYVDDDLLPTLYARALGTIYVSTYEGYGLPPLESLAAGVPVLVSDAPGLADLWPDYPLQCDAIEVDSLTAGLRRLVLDRDARRMASSEGPERVRRLTWGRAAERFARELAIAWRTERTGRTERRPP